MRASRFYFYDELDRLQKATDLTGTVLHQYGYDAVGQSHEKFAGPRARRRS
jgi:YD repeat-containing protein